VIPSTQEQLNRFIDEQDSFISLQETLKQTDTDIDWLLKQLHKLGWHTHWLEEQAFLLAETAIHAEHTLLIFNQLSSPSSNKGRRWNPELLACLAALQAYHHVVQDAPLHIKWLIDTTDGNLERQESTFKYHHELLQADACLWEPLQILLDAQETPYLVAGTQGQLCVILEAGLNAAHPDREAIIPDPAWRLIWALNSIKNASEEIEIEGFYDSLVPLEDEESEYLSSLPDNASWLAQRWGLNQLLLNLHGFQLHYTRFLVPGCTIQYLSGDQHPSSRKARARLRFSLVPGQEPGEIAQALQSHLLARGFDDIQTRVEVAYPAVRTPLTDPFVQMVSKAIGEIYGREPYLLPLVDSERPMHPLKLVHNVPILSPGPRLDKDDPASNINENAFVARVKQISAILACFQV
jgi:acetylornithine deacetylase/succinyl-diaminopimelate desuccinylase-like protein